MIPNFDSIFSYFLIFKNRVVQNKWISNSDGLSMKRNTSMIAIVLLNLSLKSSNRPIAIFFLESKFKNKL
jgi:hypothetical protein